MMIKLRLFVSGALNWEVPQPAGRKSMWALTPQPIFHNETYTCMATNNLVCQEGKAQEIWSRNLTDWRAVIVVLVHQLHCTIHWDIWWVPIKDFAFFWTDRNVRKWSTFWLFREWACLTLTRMMKQLLYILELGINIF